VLGAYLCHDDREVQRDFGHWLRRVVGNTPWEYHYECRICTHWGCKATQMQGWSTVDTHKKTKKHKQ
jgi:hypothetical protein